MTPLPLVLRRVLCVVAMCAAGASVPRATAQSGPTIPARLADSTFWRLMNDFSEPWGTFRSENFVSNETSLQWVIPALTRRIAPGGVYVGVAPDQNFTYIAALRPSIAFIVDIRHQNAIQHLMYKALFEMSKDRAEFLARLFARAPLAGVDSTASAAALFEALEKAPADSARYRENLRAITDRLVRVHRFALSDSQRISLGCVYGAFFTQGPELNYSYSSECRTPGPYGYGFGGFGGGGMGRGGFRMPSLRTMLTESDSAGVNWSYLASEKNFRLIKQMEERNLIVPLTGNFAGDKTLRAVGQWARAHQGRVTTFYVSNVEQYLFQQGDEAQRFYANVATLPLDSTSMFVRSFAGGRMLLNVDSTFQLRPQSTAGRSLQLMSPIQETLRAHEAGRLSSWMDVIGMSQQ